MNLYELLRRKDDYLATSGEVRIVKTEFQGDTWRGVQLRAGAGFRIRDALRFQTFRAWPDTCGWFAQTPPDMMLRVTLRRHETDEVVGIFEHGPGDCPVRLPWPKFPVGKVDLVVEALGALGPLERGLTILNHRAISSQWLIDAATGTGVEIGPGANPRILPREGVNVSYVEQMAPEDWNRIYNDAGRYPVRPELWKNYIVGDASNIPVAEGSLDFIFGSHVFEHLANPIGHLKRWATKLAPGGKIICVVPDLAGTRDVIQRRSTMAEWLDEYENDIWEPTVEHYERHLRLERTDRYLVRMMEKRESTHVHYYDNVNCEALLSYAVDKLGFANFVIEHTPNHKDFHFVLFNA